MKAIGTTRWGGLLLAAGLWGVCPGCNTANDAPVKLEPTMVLVHKPLEEVVPEDFLQVPGTIDASVSVNLRARVPGYLASFHFVPGADVKQGDLLFQIDSRPYDAALEQAKAAVLSFDASLKRAKADLERSTKLLPSGAISKEEYDQNVAKKAEAEAGLIAAKAKVDAEQLNVGFCRITAPCSGQIGRNLIDPGNLVAADVTELANIVAIDPVFVYFNINEADILKIHKLLLEGKLEGRKQDGGDQPFTVGVRLQNETGFPHEAVVEFIDNKLDPNTGTIRMRGTLKNPVVAHGQRAFGSGLHVDVRVPISFPYKAMLVNDRAILSQQGQKYVYVVKADKKVAVREVSVGAVKNGLRVIESGLEPNEEVIVDGLQFVRPGLSVAPQEGPMRPEAAKASEPAKAEATSAPAASPEATK